MTGIAAWLKEMGLVKYAHAFRSNDIDFDVLPSLGQDELRELGVSLGDRQRLLKAIAARSETAPETPALSTPVALTPVAPVPSTPMLTPAPGRRQLTVLFADLVGSTALSQALDAEDLRDVLQGYHDAVTAAIRDSGGFVAKFMGDGVLVYFGYPQASEEAVRKDVMDHYRSGKGPQPGHSRAQL